MREFAFPCGKPDWFWVEGGKRRMRRLAVTGAQSGIVAGRAVAGQSAGFQAPAAVVRVGRTPMKNWAEPAASAAEAERRGRGRALAHAPARVTRADPDRDITSPGFRDDDVDSLQALTQTFPAIQPTSSSLFLTTRGITCESTRSR